MRIQTDSRSCFLRVIYTPLHVTHLHWLLHQDVYPAFIGKVKLTDVSMLVICGECGLTKPISDYSSRRQFARSDPPLSLEIPSVTSRCSRVSPKEACRYFCLTRKTKQ
jgi:hypothetical protein